MSDETLHLVAVIALLAMSGAFVISVLALVAAVREMRIARREGNGRLLYARSTLRSQGLRMLKLVALGALSVTVITGVNQRWLSVVLFMTVIVAITVDVALDWVSSRKITAHFATKMRKARQ